DPDCAMFLDLGLNYLIGKGSPYADRAGPNNGRAYGPAIIFGLSGNGGTTAGILDWAMMSQMTFPESKLNTNPFWNRTADWLARTFPPGYTEAHAQWGDVQNYRPY